MRYKMLLLLLCLSMIISGCDMLPASIFPPTQTPTSLPTLILQPTETPQPTATLPEYPPLEPTPIPDDDFISDPPGIEMTYILQNGGPFYLPNFTHPEQGCAWMGVAGQVFDENAVEVLGLTVMAGSNFAGEESHRSAITGQSTAYGLGGYEIIISDNPADSSQSFWVQVFDSQGQPLSEQIYFDTYEDCESNLILVNFVPFEE
jgi:hypothetical protein